MDRIDFEKVAVKAAEERGCRVVVIDFDDDDNVFDITIGRVDGSEVDIADCEYVHRAILSAFDRDVEDYSLTVGSEGLTPEQADSLLSEIDGN